MTTMIPWPYFTDNNTLEEQHMEADIILWLQENIHYDLWNFTPYMNYLVMINDQDATLLRLKFGI